MTTSRAAKLLRRRPLEAAAALFLVFAVQPLSHVAALPKISPFSRSNNPFSRERTVLADAFPTEEVRKAAPPPSEEAEVSSALADVAANKLGAVGSIVYGAALLLHPRMFRAQVHVFTMMRAVGFGRIEAAVVHARQNYRQAMRAAVFRAPSLLMARKSLGQYQDRIDGHRRVQRETRKAMEDGIVTPAERRKINKIKRRQIRRLKRDMRRYRSATTSLGRIWKVLDFDEILDIFRQFFFILSTVLATGSNDSIIGKFVTRYCHFLNLGNLALDVNQRINFPFSRWLLYGEISDDALEKEERATARHVGTALMYSASAYLIIFKKKVGYRLNSALIASSVLVRGIMTAVGWRTGVLGDFEESLKKENGVVQRYAFKKRLSGVLIIIFAIVGMCCSEEEGGRASLRLPPALLKPLVFAEDVVEKFVFLAQKVL